MRHTFSVAHTKPDDEEAVPWEQGEGLITV